VPDAAIVEHLLGVEPKLDENFAAVGFDAVIIVSAPPTAATADFALAQAAKPEFAPILLLLLERNRIHRRPPYRACIGCTAAKSIAIG